jgi:hypothetical protein
MAIRDICSNLRYCPSTFNFQYWQAVEQQDGFENENRWNLLK